MDIGKSILGSEDRFYRDFQNQQIVLDIHKAQIKSNFNKRIPEYKDGIVVDTKPIFIKDGIII